MYLLRLFHGRLYFSEVSFAIIINQRWNFKGEHSPSTVQIYLRVMKHLSLEYSVWGPGTRVCVCVGGGCSGGTLPSISDSPPISQPAASGNRTPGRLGIECLASQHAILDAPLSLPKSRKDGLVLYPNPDTLTVKQMPLTDFQTCVSELWFVPAIAFTSFGQVDTTCISLQLIRRLYRTENTRKARSQGTCGKPGKRL